MILEPHQILSDLAAFSDLGVPPPQVFNREDCYLAHVTRHGERLAIRFLESGLIEEEIRGEIVATHATYQSLLASERFARLKDWSSVQNLVLSEFYASAPPQIDLYGFLFSESTTANLAKIEQKIYKDAQKGGGVVRILLIDGPAGIGKTEFIRQMAFRRAQNYLSSHAPLVLHVQSRGRVLTFLQDLIAFSLQTLRLQVTFDQIPILVRLGLVTLAIDGFDELGDPAGYETAWAQVAELINQVRGAGTLILAGRETFIGRDRLRRDIKALQTSDEVDSLTLQLPQPGEARDWLRSRKWTNQDFDSLSEFFEPGAFALRPLFLRQLGEDEVVKKLVADDGEGPLSMLIDMMVKREATKFGTQVDAALSEEEREAFVRKFLGEIARDVADNQSDAVDEVTIQWAVDSALGDAAPDELRRLLLNRAMVMAFLTTDERPRYRRFAHSSLLNYFLSIDTIEALCREDVPKFVRRNLFSADFLVTFAEALEKTAASRRSRVQNFMSSCIKIVRRYSEIDRGARNLSALLLCCAPFSDYVENFSLSYRQVDDALIRGTASAMLVDNCSINQLDIKGADISAISFKDCNIAGLIVDEYTKVNATVLPTYIQIESAKEAGRNLSPTRIRSELR